MKENENEYPHRRILIEALEQVKLLKRKKITAEQGNAMAGLLRQANNANKFPSEKALVRMKIERHNIEFNSNIEIDE